MRLPWMRGYLEHVAWLSDDRLVAVGWCLAPDRQVRAALNWNGRAIPLEAKWTAYHRPDVRNGRLGAGRVVVIRFPRPETPWPLRGRLVIESGLVKFSTSAVTIALRTVDAAELVHSVLSFLDHDARRCAVTLLADSLDVASSGGELAASRRAIRCELREWALSEIDSARALDSELLDQYIFPVLSRVHALESLDPPKADVFEIGSCVTAADVSIIVPLYERLDFLEHQLVQFTADPEIRKQAELVYVLDSPALAPNLLAAARQLSDLYRVPFRVAVLSRGVGYAMANNLGASVASGRLLLLLNSDVFPVTPGWLGKMIAFYESKPRIGALAPKLLFEDDGVQHAGILFRRAADGTVWENVHRYKGFERHLPAACVTTSVPAVTGACMMVARDLYVRFGGLSPQYAQGDYEDSDLCLKLLSAGYENWYLADVELYHLEGQSYWPERRARATRYNAWLHTRTWGDTIARTMAEQRKS